jgi:hypothetical protein
MCIKTEDSRMECTTHISDDGFPESGDDQGSSRRPKAVNVIHIVKTLGSLALLCFSTVITISLIFNRSTELSRISPWLALFILWGIIIWLSMMEGQQACLVGLTAVVDHLVYKDTHPIAYKGTQLAHRGDYLNKYVTGRQLMVLLSVFLINLAGAPLPGSQNTAFALPIAVQEIFLSSGVAIILMTCLIGQLPPQINASHCQIDFINNYFALFTLYTALIIEFSGLMHASYLIQYVISAISGKPVISNEAPRTCLQSLFFWLRVAMSVTILCFSFAVTVVALFKGKTTMWSGPSPAVNMVLFFVILSLAGMLEALQISFIATAKMRKELRATSYMGKRTVEVLASNEQKLPSFLIGRQLMVVSCFFILARMTTPDVKLGGGQNIFGVSDGFQSFLNTGMHAALLTTIIGSSIWKLTAWAYPVGFMNLPTTYILLWIGLALEGLGICSGAWALAWLNKKVMRLKKDEVYVGTPEHPTLSTDALDTVVTTSLDRLEDQSSSVEEKVTGKDTA